MSMHACIDGCSHGSMHTYMYVLCMYVYFYTCMYPGISLLSRNRGITHTYTYMYKCMHTYIQMNTCLHTYTYAHIHTHASTYMHIFGRYILAGEVRL